MLNDPSVIWGKGLTFYPSYVKNDHVLKGSIDSLNNLSYWVYLLWRKGELSLIERDYFELIDVDMFNIQHQLYYSSNEGFKLVIDNIQLHEKKTDEWFVFFYN